MAWDRYDAHLQCAPPPRVSPLTQSPCNSGRTQLSVGERAKITVPSNLAYGETGFAGLVPPSSTLIFDLRLLSISD